MLNAKGIPRAQRRHLKDIWKEQKTFQEGIEESLLRVVRKHLKILSLKTVNKMIFNEPKALPFFRDCYLICLRSETFNKELIRRLDREGITRDYLAVQPRPSLELSQ